MTSPLLDALASGLPPDALVTDSDVLESHRHDQASFCPAGRATILVRARSAQDVRHVLTVADDLRVPVVPQGARTGLSGAANAVDGCVLLSLERMARIVEIDEVDQVAVVEPGVLNATLSRAVLERGLFYPPDPSSWEISTIGGNIATNAGGLCCVKYGVTADFVRGLEVVLPGGTVLRTGRRTAKGVAGYDLTRLVVGSEGTLGVVTSATLALRPAPSPGLLAVGTFGSLGAAAEATTAVMSSGPRPSLLELIDAPTMRAVNAYKNMGLPEDHAAMLLVESDRAELAPADVEAYARTLRTHGAVDVVAASDVSEAAMLMEARRLVGTAMERLGSLLVDDVCVPLARLADLVAGVHAIADRERVLICCSGHAGDGNMHPAVVFDGDDPDEVARARAAFDAVMELGLRLGGTITGEHGVGVLKASWLRRELGPDSLRIHRAIRNAFDPNGIMNPGRVLA